MAQIRRWFIDWGGGPGGGGGTSALWFDTIVGTASNRTDILAFLDSWGQVANDGYSAQLRPIADIFDDATGQKIGEEAPQVSTPRFGQLTANPVPNQAQVVITFNTATFINGRRLRGRMFVPGMSVTSNTVNGEIATATLNTLTGHFPMSNQRVFSPKYLTSSSVAGFFAGSEWKVLRRRRD